MRSPFYCFLIPLFLFVSCTPSSDENDRVFHYPLRKKIDGLAFDNFDAQSEIIQQYIRRAEITNNKEELAHCYINLADLHINVGDFNYAVFLLEQAEDILQHSGKTALKAYLYHTFALLCYRTNFTDDFALSYNTRAVNFMKQSSIQERKIYNLDRIYLVRADYFATQGKPDSANIYLHKAISNAASKLNLAQSLASLAELKIHNFKMDSADVYSMKALDLIKQIKGKTFVHAYTYHVAGSYYSDIQDYKKAETNFLKALEINREISYNHLTPFLYYKIRELYQKQGDKEKAQQYEDITEGARELMYSSRSKAIKSVNEMLISDTNAEKQQKLKKNWNYSILLFAILTTAISIFTYKRIKTLKLKKERLIDETEALRQQKNQLQHQFQDKRFEEVMTAARKNDPTFLTRFTDLYPDFISKLQQINPELEKSELIFCAMLKLNFSSKEIARNISIQHASVQKRKSRLRKRLHLESQTDLYDFLNELGQNKKGEP